MLCVSIKPTDNEQLQEQLGKAKEHSPLIELRLDALDRIDPDILGNIVIENPNLEFIFTLRSASQGGDYPGSEENRFLLLEELAKARPAYLDVEFPDSNRFVPNLKANHPMVKILLSYHSFSGKVDPESIYKKMKATSADLYKIAVMVEEVQDSWELLHLMKKYSSDLVVCGMGEKGEITRILTPVYGGKFCYAGLGPEYATAPGQLSAFELEDIYCYSRLNGETKVCCMANIENQTLKNHNLNAKERGENLVYIKII